jgi:hypothetical protein
MCICTRVYFIFGRVEVRECHRPVLKIISCLSPFIHNDCSSMYTKILQVFWNCLVMNLCNCNDCPCKFIAILTLNLSYCCCRDEYLESHIKFLESQGIAGVSHHSLLFSKTETVQLAQEEEDEIRWIPFYCFWVQHNCSSFICSL